MAPLIGRPSWPRDGDGPALILQRFTGGLPWAHLDIAGPGRSAETSGYLSKGGTAFALRTLLALLDGYGSTAGREEPHSADS